MGFAHKFSQLRIGPSPMDSICRRLLERWQKCILHRVENMVRKGEMNIARLSTCFQNLKGQVRFILLPP